MQLSDAVLVRVWSSFQEVLGYARDLSFVDVDEACRVKLLSTVSSCKRGPSTTTLLTFLREQCLFVEGARVVRGREIALLFVLIV